MNFLRNCDFCVDHGGCPNNFNALMSTFDFINFISAHYKGYEVYTMAGRTAWKMLFKEPIHPLNQRITRKAMFLEREHFKNSKVPF